MDRWERAKKRNEEMCEEAKKVFANFRGEPHRDNCPECGRPFEFYLACPQCGIGQRRETDDIKG